VLRGFCPGATLRHTASSRVRGSEECEWLLQVIDTINLLFSFIELDADSRSCRRDVLERSSGWETKRFLEFFDQCVRIQSIQQVDITRGTRKDYQYGQTWATMRQLIKYL